MNTEKTPTYILAEFLREARLKAGLTQKQVAQQLGYSTAQFVSSWERAEREPPMHVIWTLSVMYNISAEAIFETMLEYRTQTLSLELRAEFDAAKPKINR